MTIQKKNRYTIHVIEGQIQSIFIAEYRDRILLLDGGCRCDIPLITGYINGTMKRDLSEVLLSVLSHAHPDHAGAAPFMRKLFGIPLAAHRDIDYWYSGFRGQLQHISDTVMAWIVVFRKGRPFRRLWFNRAFRPDYPLKDGDTLPFFPDWKVLHLPGHTSHDIALYNEKQGDLYAGDLILKVQSRYIPPFPVTMPVKMEASLKRLACLKVRRLFLAHGGTVTEEITPEFFLSAIPYIGVKLKPMMRLIWYFTRFSKGIQREK